MVSLLWASLGPVTAVTADAGPADASYLILHHEGGATSTVTVSQGAGEAAAGFEAFVWGGAGRSAAPAGASDPLPPLRTALAELSATSGRGGPITRVTRGSAGTWAASSPRPSARSTSGARMWVKPRR